MTGVTDILAEFAHLKEASLLVSKLINSVKELIIKPLYIDDTYEIEARLGNILDEKFDANVGQTTFCSVLTLLENYTGWARVIDWSETQDVFFSTNVPDQYTFMNSGEVQVRTRVGEGFSGELEIQHHTKQRLKKVDLVLSEIDATSCTSETTKCKAKIGFDDHRQSTVDDYIYHSKYKKVEQ